MRKVTCVVLAVVFLVSLAVIPGCNRSDQPSVTGSGMELSAVLIGLAEIEVVIDIIPCKDNNPINCGALNRTVAVAILGTDDFEVADVDHTTVTFEGADPAVRVGSAVERHEKDVNGDGLTDLVFHFVLDDTNLDCGSTEGTLTGYTNGGIYIYDTDIVNMFGG